MATTFESSQEEMNSEMDALSSEQLKSPKEAYEAILSGSRDAIDQGSSSNALSQTSQMLGDEFSETKFGIVKGFTNCKNRSKVQWIVPNFC
ncbi:hypothetical protein GOP47_0029753 [Adiantum capillus-veneris]|nr:hypothetical protein GOP47_0029753 [Adiantum capillus-veneris]